MFNYEDDNVMTFKGKTDNYNDCNNISFPRCVLQFNGEYWSEAYVSTLCILFRNTVIVFSVMLIVLAGVF